MYLVQHFEPQGVRNVQYACSAVIKCMELALGFLFV